MTETNDHGRHDWDKTKAQGMVTIVLRDGSRCTVPRDEVDEYRRRRQIRYIVANNSTRADKPYPDAATLRAARAGIQADWAVPSDVAALLHQWVTPVSVYVADTVRCDILTDALEWYFLGWNIDHSVVDAFLLLMFGAETATIGADTRLGDICPRYHRLAWTAFGNKAANDAHHHTRRSVQDNKADYGVFGVGHEREINPCLTDNSPAPQPPANRRRKEAHDAPNT